jgi:hypothetical protein
MLVWDGQAYTSPVKLQIDCGATVNVIPRRHVPKTGNNGYIINVEEDCCETTRGMCFEI